MPDLFNPTATRQVLEKVFKERQRQVSLYGQNHGLQDGTGPSAKWLPQSDQNATEVEAAFRADYEYGEHLTGAPTWLQLVREEVAEAFKAATPDELAEELIQVAALCVSWVETLKVRQATQTYGPKRLQKALMNGTFEDRDGCAARLRLGPSGWVLGRLECPLGRATFVADNGERMELLGMLANWSELEVMEP